MSAYLRKNRLIFGASLFVLVLAFCLIFKPVLAAANDSAAQDSGAVQDQSAQDPSAQDASTTDAAALAANPSSDTASTTDNVCQALVVKILAEKVVTNDSGLKVKQQNIQLKILTGPLTGQIVEYDGISDVQVVNSNVYHKNDKVVVNYSPGQDGNNVFYITDYIRQNSLGWLLVLFVLVIILVGKKKGLRALLSLGLSFWFVVKVMSPLMLLGWDPLLVGIAGSFVILLLIVYLTEGVNRRSHVAVIGILASLIVTALLAIIFSNWSHLTGMSHEEVTYLINAGKVLNFKSLLWAAIIIGTLGIMDDVAVGQVETVQQLKEANNKLPSMIVFKRAMKVGESHLGAIINTLFLAYAGEALPLLLLINLNQAPFVSFSDIINNEQIASEITRTLVGVIGLCLALPITTWMAAKYLKVDGKEDNKKKDKI